MTQDINLMFTAERNSCINQACTATVRRRWNDEPGEINLVSWSDGSTDGDEMNCPENVYLAIQEAYQAYLENEFEELSQGRDDV